MSVRPGQPWERPAAGRPEHEVHGGDRELAAAVAAHPGARFRFLADPSSDVARAIGARAGAHAVGAELAMDALAWNGRLAVNMVVVGVPPDRLTRWTRAPTCSVAVDGHRVFAGRATSVVVATGQFLRGANVVPRGHPGDGRIEILVLHVPPGQRAGLRRRITTGDHLPHPSITQRSGRAVTIEAATPVRIEADGASEGAVARVVVEVVAGAYRLVV